MGRVTRHTGVLMYICTISSPQTSPTLDTSTDTVTVSPELMTLLSIVNPEYEKDV